MPCGEVKDWIGDWCEEIISRMLGDDFVGPPTRIQQNRIDMLRSSHTNED